VDLGILASGAIAIADFDAGGAEDAAVLAVVAGGTGVAEGEGVGIGEVMVAAKGEVIGVVDDRVEFAHVDAEVGVERHRWRRG
jgi:hypothetical protein